MRTLIFVNSLCGLDNQEDHMSLPLKEWSEDPEALENNPLIGLFEPLHLALRTVVSCCLTADASTSILASLSVVIFSEVKPEKTKRVEDNDDH